METIYRKVFIKSEADLPEKDGVYFANRREFGETSIHYWKNNLARKRTWINGVDWYLQPVELPDDEEIERWIDLELKKLKLPHIYSNELLNGWMIFTAKRFRDKLINK